MRKFIKIAIIIYIISNISIVPIYAKFKNNIPQEINNFYGLTKNVSKNNITLSTLVCSLTDELNINVKNNTLIIDAISGNIIDISDIKLNEPTYVYLNNENSEIKLYAEVIITNIPKDSVPPAYVTVKETIKNDKGELEIKVFENQNIYILSKDTYFKFISNSNSKYKTKSPKIEQLTKGSKLLLYTNNDNTLSKCLLIPIEVYKLTKIDLKNNLKEKIVNLPIYNINNKNYSPLKVIAQNIGYKLW